MLEREPENVEHDGRIEQPPGPELPAAEAAPAGQQQAATAPGRERDDQLQQQEEHQRGDAQIERRMRGEGAEDALDHFAAGGGEPDDERRPDQAGDEEVSGELRKAGAQHPRREIAGQPGTGQQSGGEDQCRAFALDPLGAPGDRVGREEPAHRRALQDGPSRRRYLESILVSGFRHEHATRYSTTLRGSIERCSLCFPAWHYERVEKNA